jgi:hypothetical protein
MSYWHSESLIELRDVEYRLYGSLPVIRCGHDLTELDLGRYFRIHE